MARVLKEQTGGRQKARIDGVGKHAWEEESGGGGGGGGASVTIPVALLGLAVAPGDAGCLRRWADNGSGTLADVGGNCTLAHARRAIGVLNPAGDTFIVCGQGALAIINDGQGSGEEFPKGAPVFAAADHLSTAIPGGGELSLVVGFTLVASTDPAYDSNTPSVPIFVNLGSPVIP
jgi:hypothetical protein